MTAWPLRWSHGQGLVESVGGMVGPVHFQICEDQWRQPFAVFPWADEPTPEGESPLQGLMARGRGEWPCVPFGVNPDANALGWDHPIHGHSAHGPWQRLDDGQDPAFIHLQFTYPDGHPVARLERQIWGVDGQAAMGLRLIVHAREACRLPMGLHFTFKMPQSEGALSLQPTRWAFAQTFPREVEPGFDLLEPGQRFHDLAHAPAQNGQTADISQFPLPQATESLCQLCGVEGDMVLIHREEGYRVVLQWDTQALPSCLLWISNGGRQAWPWSRRHHALGVEPVCAYFDEGVLASANPNPINASGIATAVALSTHRPFVTDYRMSLHGINPETSS